MIDNIETIEGISKFYSGKNILITGGTGYIGKALVEKLLRSCPDLGVVYMIIRPKRGKGLEERLKILCEDPVYERLKKERPEITLEKKIVPLTGDMLKLNLGLSQEHRKLITDNVNIIFNVAATVRFDESLKNSVLLNVRGAREICQIALEAKNLESFIHVSTAYANCDRTVASEVLYPAHADWKKTINIVENFDEEVLPVITSKYIGVMPNTYCFTKNLAEHVINDMCQGKIRFGIVRPSIVVGAIEEPIAGWMDNFNGPLSILIAFGKGIMRTVYSEKSTRPDYIPIDIVAKSLAVCAWYVSHHSTPTIFHCTSHTATWLRVTQLTLAQTYLSVMPELPFNDVLWQPNPHTTSNKLGFYLRTVFFMLLPSVLCDGVLKLAGKKPRLLKLQKKIYIAQLALRHFLTHEWVYTNDHLLKMQKNIPPPDLEVWDFEFQNYDFKKYLKNCILGARRYLLFETDETLPRARKHLNRMFWIDKFVQVVFLGAFLYFFYCLAQRFIIN